MDKFEIIVEIRTSITRERVIYMACTGEYAKSRFQRRVANYGNV